jgi:hypothetical protein
LTARARLVSAASRPAALLGLFVALAVVMTWPQARYIATRAIDHQDVYFNMWRLAWFARALTHAPFDLFDANIFYPETNTLAFSDAMMVEGLIAAPLLWGGLPPVLVHNLLLLGAVVASALGMFVLVERLTQSRAAAVVAGIIFAFAPYRFEHYMHMELQWTVWMPWAFWAVHRTIDSGRWLHGLQAGAFVALQMLSSVYYGIFLATVLPMAAGLLLLSVTRDRAVAALKALALGGVAAAIVCGAYALPYLAAKERVGERSKDEIVRFSARPSDYLVATPDNRLYGGGVFVGRSERRLFPGLVASLLAMIGLLLRPPTRSSVVYAIALVVAFDMSLGFRGFAYPFLYDHVPVFSALRAPARLGIFVILFLAVLAADGYTALRDAVPAVVRRWLPVVLPCAMLLEYSVSPLQLVPYPNTPPPVYKFLSQLPPGVVAEFPTPPPYSLPGPEARHSYMSTFHWNPILNGYSGFYPPSYLRRLASFRSFPDAASLNVLRETGVRYVVLHVASVDPVELWKARTGVQAFPELEQLGQFGDGVYTALVYELK